ncbi:MAG: hypothetical protein WCQ96_02740 [Patescibacteria group bacterium]
MKENKKAYVIIIKANKQLEIQKNIVELGNSLNTHFTPKLLYRDKDFVFLRIEEFGWNNHFEPILNLMFSLGSVKKINTEDIEKNFKVAALMEGFNVEFFSEGGIDFKQLIIRETETGTTGCIA